MPLLHPYDALILTLAVQAAQWSTALLYWRRMRAGVSAKPGSYAPPAALIVPCKGKAGDFEENVRSFLDQDYPGKLTKLFVVPSEDDPATAALRRLGARVLVSDAEPETSSGKIADLLFAFEQLPSDAEVVLFSDSDVAVRPDWARRMIAPLKDSKTAVTTSAMVYAPMNFRPSNLLRSVWMMTGVMYSYFMDSVTGQSMGVRKKEFDSLGLRAAWETSLLEDLATGRAVRAKGKRVAFVFAAVPVSREDSSMAFVASVFTRWLRCIRFDDPRMWALSIPLVAVKSAVAVSTLLRASTWDRAALFWLLEGGFLAFVAWTYASSLPDRFAGVPRCLPLRAALSAPGVLALQAWNILCAAASREVRWGGRRYRLESAGKIALLKP